MWHKNSIQLTLFVAIGILLARVCPAQETDFRGWEDTPGLYFYLAQPESSWAAGVFAAEHVPAHERVSGTSALRLTFAASHDQPAALVFRPPGSVIRSRTGYAGISIWIKSDGTEGVGVIGIGEGSPLDPRVTFRLGQKSWQPLRVRWEDFDRPLPAGAVPSLFFSVAADTKRPVSYTVDRIELIRGIGPALDDGVIRTRGEATGKLAEIPRPDDFAAFATEPKALAGLRGSVAGKKSLRVLIIGDSIALGSALWNVPPGAKSRFVFPGAFERELKAKSPDSTVDVVVVDSPEAAAAQTPAALAKFKPGLVVIEISCSQPGPAGFGAVPRSRESLKSVYAACRAANAECVALAIPPLPDPFKRVNYASILLEEAAAAKSSAIDFGKFASARGKGFEGEYYATPDQLNVQGQFFAAKLLCASVIP